MPTFRPPSSAMPSPPQDGPTPKEEFDLLRDVWKHRDSPQAAISRGEPVPESYDNQWGVPTPAPESSGRVINPSGRDPMVMGPEWMQQFPQSRRAEGDFRMEPSGATTSIPGANAPSSALDDPRIKQMVADYPELAGPLVKVISRLEADTNQLSEKTRLLQEEADQLIQDERRSALDGLAPGWREVIAQPEFAAWLSRQPKYVQDAAREYAEGIVDPMAIADLVDQFKRSQRGAGVAAPSRPMTTRGAPSVATVDQAPEDPEAAWLYFDRLDRAKA